jgi:uncharacterized protein YdhG (YjbR/CyaY superfamily)
MKQSAGKQKDGPQEERFRDGTLSARGRLAGGKRVGVWKFYYRNGQLKATGRFVAGALDGQWKWYRESGLPLQTGSFAKGKQHGPWKRWLANGKPNEAGNFTAGKKTGEWTFFDEEGRVLRKKKLGSTRNSGARSETSAIDGYLATLSSEKRVALERLRKTIRAAAPGAEECISYQLPAFRLGGKALVAFGATTKHCTFFPMSGTTVQAHAAELEHYDTSKGAIRFQPDDPLPATLVRKLVKARIAENDARRPARRK